jgi:hypothetical protein
MKKSNPIYIQVSSRCTDCGAFDCKTLMVQSEDRVVLKLLEQSNKRGFIEHKVTEVGKR